MAQKALAPEVHPQTYAPDGDVPGDLAALRAATKAWRDGAVARSLGKMPERKARFSTWSDLPVTDVLTPADVRFDYTRDLGLPGEYPFTRGVQPTMYRSRLW